MKHICKHKFTKDGKMIVAKPVLTADELQYNFDRLTAMLKNREIDNEPKQV